MPSPQANTRATNSREIELQPLMWCVGKENHAQNVGRRRADMVESLAAWCLVSVFTRGGSCTQQPKRFLDDSSRALAAPRDRPIEGTIGWCHDARTHASHNHQILAHVV